MMNRETANLRRFDLSVFLHFIGRMIYMTFIPIVLLENGYSLNEVFLYLIGFSVLTILFLVASVKLFSRKNVLLFYVLAVVAEIFLVILLIPQHISYVVLSLIILLQGAYYAYYYISYNSIVAHYTSRKRTSDNLGNLGIVIGISNIIAPLAGAFLLSIDKSLFIAAAIIFLLASMIPLIRITRTDINGSKLKRIYAKDLWYELFSCSSMNGIGFVVFLLWSIFVYVSGFPLIYVGAVPAIEALLQIILMKTIKKRLVSLRFRAFIKIISVAGIILFSVYRFFFPSQVLFTSFALASFFVAFYLSVNSDYFEKIESYQTYYPAMLLEVVEFGGWVIIAIVAALVGLKYSILISVVLSIAWLAVSSKRIINQLKRRRKPLEKAHREINPRHVLVRKV